MAFLRFNEIVTKVYDILRQDARTLNINWAKQKLVAATIKDWPAGAIYVEGAGLVTPETMPGGDVGLPRVSVEAFFMSHEGMETAEEIARDALDQILDVLVNTARGSELAYSIGLEYAYPVRVEYALRLQPEATPPYANVMCVMPLEIRPT